VRSRWSDTRDIKRVGASDRPLKSHDPESRTPPRCASPAEPHPGHDHARAPTARSEGDTRREADECDRVTGREVDATRDRDVRATPPAEESAAQWPFAIRSIATLPEPGSLPLSAQRAAHNLRTCALGSVYRA
jgi:hypothetical protein